MTSLIVVLLLTTFAPQAPPPQALKPDPLAVGLRSLYQSIRRNVVDAAALMPESEYGFRPAAGVRTFGQLVGHLTNTQYNFCSPARGLPNPTKSNHETHATKAALVEALNEAMAFCDPVYQTLTDADLSAPATWGDAIITKGNALMFNVAHDNEHYGNMVTYLRLKGLVPPSTARNAR